jgi:hypothetical protein
MTSKPSRRLNRAPDKSPSRTLTGTVVLQGTAAKKTAEPSPKNGSYRREMFVRNYLIDLSATQAAIRAGYSPKTARAQGARL